MQVGCDRFEIEVIELRENSKHSRDTKRERERESLGPVNASSNSSYSG